MLNFCVIEGKIAMEVIEGLQIFSLRHKKSIQWVLTLILKEVEPVEQDGVKKMCTRPFNDGHVLQLKPETVAVRRRKGNVLDDYDGQMVSGDKCGLNFLTFVLQLRKNPGKDLNQETDPTGIWTRARWMRGNDVTSRS